MACHTGRTWEWSWLIGIALEPSRSSYNYENSPVWLGELVIANFFITFVAIVKKRCNKFPIKSNRMKKVLKILSVIYIYILSPEILFYGRKLEEERSYRLHAVIFHVCRHHQSAEPCYWSKSNWCLPASTWVHHHRVATHLQWYQYFLTLSWKIILLSDAISWVAVFKAVG